MKYLILFILILNLLSLPFVIIVLFLVITNMINNKESFIEAFEKEIDLLNELFISFK